MPNKIPRLDILLYAHDGRGLGHVSRTIAIGIALRRLFPELRVLLLSGCSISQEFIGSAPLDWIKLPSYETVIKSGKSAGIPGKSNFEDRELGTLRGEQIRQIVTLYRPRVVLADHSQTLPSKLAVLCTVTLGAASRLRSSHSVRSSGLSTSSGTACCPVNILYRSGFYTPLAYKVKPTYVPIDCHKPSKLGTYVPDGRPLALALA